MNRLLQAWRARFQQWVNRRIKPATQVRLGRNNLFIFPGRAGLGFLLLLALLWLLGTNYANNLVLLLAFLLIAVGVIAILHTYRNLAGLTLQGLEVQPVFAGERAAFQLRLTGADGKGQQISLGWRGIDCRWLSMAGTEATLSLWAPSQARGWLHPGRLLVESYYPLGLIRCWTWLDLDLRALVYPRPLASQQAPWAEAQGEMDEHLGRTGTEDFVGLSPFQPGQPLSRVSWKHLARGQGLQLKEFADPQGQAQALDWDFYQGLDTETRLSHLCYWVLYLDQRGLPFSLRLPDCALSMGQGDGHREQCLRALALHGSSAHAD